MTQAMTIPAPDENAVTGQAIMKSINNQSVTITGTAQTQNVTRSVPVEEQKNMQDKKEPESIPKGTEQGTNGTPEDTINANLDAALTRARLTCC